MMLPGLPNAQVPQDKIRKYLLSCTHPGGLGKALFFLRFGFRPVIWKELATALVQHAATNKVCSSEETFFGTKYVIDGPIGTPDGRNPSIRAVWFREKGQSTPRFVTAYPRRKEHE